MIELPISPKSHWQQPDIQTFLHSQFTPMRLAVADHEGFPMICSVWHYYDQGKLYAVAHKDSKLIKKLMAQPKCAFEIAPNEPPYKGVRGQAVCDINQDASFLLPHLIKCFLHDQYPHLSEFLLQRIHEERVIELTIKKITAWDFSERMKKT